MTEQQLQLSLASRSPRRRELLDQIGIRYRLVEVSVDETAHKDEPPVNFVERLARAKADAGHAAHGDLPALGADTCVVADSLILGKPESEQHAIEMLQCLSNRNHQVYTAVAISHRSCISCVSVSSVWFRKLDLKECQRYVATGESLDKAGGYAVQGLAASFIERIDGSYSGIMGLPVFETAQLLKLVDIHIV